MFWGGASDCLTEASWGIRTRLQITPTSTAKTSVATEGKDYTLRLVEMTAGLQGTWRIILGD